MAIAVTGVLAPTGIQGPPEVMAGFATATGDVSGGNTTISFFLAPGFLWMPLFMSFGVDSAVAVTFRMDLLETDDQLAQNTSMVALTEDIAATTLGNLTTRAFPRMLIRTVQVAPEARFFIPNVSTRISQCYMRALRWPRNAAPEAFLAYLTAPP